MRFIAIVIAVVFAAAVSSFITFIDGIFGEPYGELAVIGIVSAFVLMAFFLIIKVNIHNKKVLKARADIAKATENPHKRKSSKDWV